MPTQHSSNTRAPWSFLQVTLARACQVAFTGLLCLFTCIALFPVCLLRATLGPGVGIFSNLGVGITILQGQFSWAPVHGYQLIWKDVCIFGSLILLVSVGLQTFDLQNQLCSAFNHRAAVTVADLYQLWAWIDDVCTNLEVKGC